MLGSTFIETAIGLSLIFLLMSLMCSVLCEVISRWRRWRARLLFQAVRGLVHDEDLAEMIYAHPLIQALGAADWRGAWQRPSYLPSSLFARVLIDVVRLSGPFIKLREAMAKGTSKRLQQRLAALAVPGRFASVDALREAVNAVAQEGSSEDEREREQQRAALNDFNAAISTDAFARSFEAPVEAPGLEELKAAVEALPSPELRLALRALILDPEITTQEMASKAIAGWFDAAMERLSGRYKRLTQVTVFSLAGPLTLGLNVDALHVANQLQRDKSLRDAVVASASSFASERKALGAEDLALPKANDVPASAPGDVRLALFALEAQLEQLDLPIGWVTDAEVTTADEDASAARRALKDAREDAELPAAVWKRAREDVKVKADAVVAAMAKSDDDTARAAVMEAMKDYEKAKAAALVAKGEDEKARAAVALALAPSEHLRLAAEAMRSRTLKVPRISFGATVYKILLRLAGWLFTALAVSLGTRFWFDTLDKLVSIRSGVKPEKKEADKDGA